MTRWHIHDAKSKRSELVRKACREGPRVITLRGRDAVVVLAVDEIRRMASQRGSLAALLRNSPLSGVDLNLGRSNDTNRDVINKWSGCADTSRIATAEGSPCGATTWCAMSAEEM